MTSLTKKDFKHMYDSYFDSIRNYVYYRSGDADLATDIAQETFLKVWEKQLGGKQIRALLYKIAGDLFVSYYRKTKLAENYAIDFKLRYSETEDDAEESNRVKALYEKALARLPDKQRIVFLMNKMEGLTYKEIADSLNISVKAIEKRMSLALKYLKTELNKVA